MSQENSAWTPEIEQLLEDWRKRVYAAQSSYYEEAERLRRRNYQLGMPLVIVSSLVGTAVFADWGQDATSKWWVGSVSIVAAILASLQTFLKFGESASLHGAAADWFAAIRRDIEEVLALPPELRGSPKECLDSIRHEMNKAGQKAPALGEGLWRRAARRFGVEEMRRCARLRASAKSGPGEGFPGRRRRRGDRAPVEDAGSSQRSESGVVAVTGLVGVRTSGPAGRSVPMPSTPCLSRRPG